MKTCVFAFAVAVAVVSATATQETSPEGPDDVAPVQPWMLEGEW